MSSLQTHYHTIDVESMVDCQQRLRALADSTGVTFVVRNESAWLEGDKMRSQMQFMVTGNSAQIRQFHSQMGSTRRTPKPDNSRNQIDASLLRLVPAMAIALGVAWALIAKFL